MIEYRTDLAGITADQLVGPFFVGWPDPPDAATHLAVLRGSTHVVLAVDHHDQRVVGFVNALADGVLMAFIPLLEVTPEYQGRGIGSELMRRMLGLLVQYYAVDAVTDPELQPFYRHLGLQPAAAVSLRNYARQSGT